MRRPRVFRHAVAGAVVAVYLLAAAIVVGAHSVLPVPWWLALHLLVLGAATNAVFVWSRFFAEALLHTRPESGRPAAVRLTVLNAGVIAILGGVTGGLSALAVVGAGLVVGTVIAHSASLVRMLRSSPLAGPLGILAWYYVAAGTALAAGGTLGGVLAAGWARSPSVTRALLLAHAELNLLGWLGLAIIGTQFMLWPMVLRTRLGESVPRTARRVLALTTCGLALTVTALLISPRLSWAGWPAAAGTAVYLAGAGLALVPAIGLLRAKRPRTAAPWTFLAGNAWLIIALAANTAGLAAGPGTADHVLSRLVIPALVVGVIAQTLIGALTFLLPVTVGGGPIGNRRLTGVLERGWHLRLALGNAGVLALVARPAGGWVMVAAWAAVLAGFGTFPLLAIAALIAGRAGLGPMTPAAGQRESPPG